jgi:hypothetical protein
MNFTQIHALFGESEAVLWAHSRGERLAFTFIALGRPFGRLAYCDYGVELKVDYLNGFQVIAQKADQSSPGPRGVWDWLESWKEEARNEKHYPSLWF